MAEAEIMFIHFLYKQIIIVTKLLQKYYLILELKSNLYIHFSLYLFITTQ